MRVSCDNLLRQAPPLQPGHAQWERQGKYFNSSGFRPRERCT